MSEEMITEEAEVDLGQIDQIIASVGRDQRHLIAILRAIQDRYNYLPEAALRRVAEVTEISAASVAGPASRRAVHKVCAQARRHGRATCIC